MIDVDPNWTNCLELHSLCIIEFVHGHRSVLFIRLRLQLHTKIMIMYIKGWIDFESGDITLDVPGYECEIKYPNFSTSSFFQCLLMY